MATKRQSLYILEKQLNQAMARLQADTAASPALARAMKKFRKKLKETVKAMECAADDLFDHVIELEQAADETKYDLELNKSLSAETRREVLAAYMCVAGLRCRSGIDCSCVTLLHTGHSKESIESCKLDLKSNYPFSRTGEKG